MEIKNEILNLKRKLTEEIQKENSDNNIILSLSNEIAKLNESEIRFSVDAGIINRLGKELVGRHETAVSELVKNAYDADATEVKLVFKSAWESSGTLYIEDNGVGMTKDQLINGFMRLSSSEKLHFPISNRYKRTRAGRKGIGRFATQRLGNKLTIITQTIDSLKALKIIIEWDKFETDKNLLSITNQLEYIEKTKAEGTDLIIEGLREGWSDAMIKRVYRYTSELLQPFPLSKKKIKEEKTKVDPGFKSFYFRTEGESLIPIIDEEEAIFKHSLAEIEGYVMNDGQGCWSLKSEKLNFPEEIFLIGNNGKDRDDVDSKFNLVKGIHFKTYYFVYDPSLFATGTFNFIRNLAYEKGGLRLYRNGFRVLPYGEEGNDWLGLDKSNSRNVVLGPHMNICFFGFVEIDDREGKKFEETSSREGLIENDALKELVDFVFRSIISAVQKVSELRGRKATASQKGYKRKDENASQKVDSVVTKMKAFFQDENDEEFESSSDGKANDSSNSKKKFKETFKELEEAIEEEKKERQLLINEVNMLRILAGLGLVIGEFVHEVKRFLPGFDADVNFLKEAVKTHKESLERVELLDSNVRAFTTYTSYFNKAISRNVLRELEPIELRDVVRDFERVVINDLKRSKINLHKHIFIGHDLFTVPMHPSEWASILFNLYTNSKKAIKRSKKSGEIQIKCGKENDIVYLEFSDNGDGIQKENEEYIFNAFFTTTSAANHSANDADNLVGTGLGLKIVKDIIEVYGGTIYVALPSEGFVTTFRIEIPKNKSEND